MTSQTTARSIPCSRCGAAAGAACGVIGLPSGSSYHVERTIAAAAASRAANLAARAAATMKGSPLTTSPFDRVALQPASPAWIVRMLAPPAARAVEVVFVGHANRMELDAAVERLARYPWHFDAKAVERGDASIVVLADARAESIGVRLIGLLDPSTVLDRVEELAGSLTLYAVAPSDARRLK